MVGTSPFIDVAGDEALTRSGVNGHSGTAIAAVAVAQALFARLLAIFTSLRALFAALFTNRVFAGRAGREPAVLRAER
jgi:hypothetical protein